MAGAMLNNSSFSRKIQEEIHGPTYAVSFKVLPTSIPSDNEPEFPDDEVDKQPNDEDVEHPSSPTNDESEDDVPIFEVKEKTVKTGAKKGTVVKTVTIGIHTFKKRKKIRNGNVVFTCNDCQRKNRYISAVASVDEETDQYKLIRAPHFNDHVCWPTGMKATIKRAKLEMCKKVEGDPTSSFYEVYL